jgi:hypothetical protein
MKLQEVIPIYGQMVMQTRLSKGFISSNTIRQWPKVVRQFVIQ